MLHRPLFKNKIKKVKNRYKLTQWYKENYWEGEWKIRGDKRRVTLVLLPLKSSQICPFLFFSIATTLPQATTTFLLGNWQSPSNCSLRCFPLLRAATVTCLKHEPDHQKASTAFSIKPRLVTVVHQTLHIPDPAQVSNYISSKYPNCHWGRSLLSTPGTHHLLFWVRTLAWNVLPLGWFFWLSAQNVTHAKRHFPSILNTVTSSLKLLLVMWLFISSRIFSVTSFSVSVS